MKYDDASWHYGGDFQSDLPNNAGATHTGMYVAWALLNDLAGDFFTEDSPEDLLQLQKRETTPGAFFISMCDGKFTDDDVNDEGNSFTEYYFDFENGRYLDDYEEILCKELPSLYHVKDSWENFDKISPIIAKRYKEWKKKS
ncbi:MAG: hypothetical protein PVJ68_06280 [Candidatus Thiodiazotropha sp.]|jgi:hypothetical protein